ncbi:MAG TPA: 1,4-alpha-glucan branching protein GlgB [Vicinamibacterales bacterium]
MSLEALARGQHHDPFRLLGPHLDHGRLVVRALCPWASSIELDLRRPIALRVEMTRRHPDGLFQAIVPEVSSLDGVEYRLVIHDDTGTREIDDPYRFGRSISDYDLHLFGEGNLLEAHRRLGAHPTEVGGIAGVHFAVWAPNAQRVSVIGDFNRWDGRVHPMRQLVPSGVWELFIPGLADGERYKFEVRTHAGHLLHKADPYARFFEVPPRSAAIVCRTDGYAWQDQAWMEARQAAGAWLAAPMSVYEVHLPSWRTVPEEDNRPLTYRELADHLVPYVKDLGFTHIELMPVLEHPYGGSWGYQVLGYFAPTSRLGHPHDFKYFVDRCHQAGLGVILDWVPAHFPKDAHGLARFDGTALYEHEDPRLGEHQDWGTLIFNYGRNEVRNFLLASALFWLEEYHIDGLRVDAVASMLYLDYSRREGEWIPNRYGGRENLEAVAFLQQMNTLTHARVPGSITIAEESTAWPGVSRPVHLGGLGFTYKWNMGWMHDTLKYASRDPVHRRWAQNEITFSMLYAYTENYILPYSHDEVVHGKRSMLDKMPGDTWQKAATLRALYAFMYAHPGKKLLFMGCEFGQWREWNYQTSLDWDLLAHEPHRGLVALVRELNALYRSEPALSARDYDLAGFRWIDASDVENSVIAFLRAAGDDDLLAIVCNWTPVPRHGYRIGMPRAGRWLERLNTDDPRYGGSGVMLGGGVDTEPIPAHGYPQSIALTLPPLATVILKPETGPL